MKNFPYILFILLSTCLATEQVFIEFTYIPQYGVTPAVLQGKVTGVIPSEYKIAVYIHYLSWWIKPYAASPLTNIADDGTWNCSITTGGNDEAADKLAAFLIPNGYTPPIALGWALLPEALYQNSLDYLVIARLQKNPAYDFDGDHKADIGIWDKTNSITSGIWLILKSGSNYHGYISVVKEPPGEASWIITPADFDGDSKADPGIYYKTGGHWYVLKSSQKYQSFFYFCVGNSDYIPVAGDYDGDGKADPCVYNKMGGHWYMLLSGTNYSLNYVGWGGEDCLPVPADYDGDGKCDVSVWQKSTGKWFILLSSQSNQQSWTKTWGAPGEAEFRPVPADFDADSKADLAVWNEQTGEWFVLLSKTNTVLRKTFGKGGSAYWIPVPADFDGDDHADIALWQKSTGVWFWLTSMSNYNTCMSQTWQAPGNSMYTPVVEMLYTRTAHSLASHQENTPEPLSPQPDASIESQATLPGDLEPLHLYLQPKIE